MGKYESFVNWFEGRLKPLKLTGYVYEADRHNGWGNTLSWSDYDNRRVVGWLQRRPQVGDEILWTMESGKAARYGVTRVEYMSDPNDMFFADVMDIGYEGEQTINRVKEAAKREIEPRSKGLQLLR